MGSHGISVTWGSKPRKRWRTSKNCPKEGQTTALPLFIEGSQTCTLVAGDGEAFPWQRRAQSPWKGNWGVWDLPQKSWKTSQQRENPGQPHFEGGERNQTRASHAAWQRNASELNEEGIKEGPAGRRGLSAILHLMPLEPEDLLSLCNQFPKATCLCFHLWKCPPEGMVQSRFQSHSSQS